MFALDVNGAGFLKAERLTLTALALLIFIVAAFDMMKLTVIL